MITSVDNQRVKDVVRLRRARERRASGLFIAEGVREVERAREAGLVIRETFVAPELLPWNEPYTEVTARVLAKMAYRPEPEGVLAIVEAPQRKLPEHATFVLVAVGIEKPGNLGAMARTADAARVDAILVADGQTDPWNPNAIRASTGAVFTLPIVEATRSEIAALAQRKIAAVVGAPTPYTSADLTQPTALIVGAEDTGLSDEWKAIADERVSLPINGNTADSLNAAAAVAVLVYETLRQRG